MFKLDVGIGSFTSTLSSIRNVATSRVASCFLLLARDCLWWASLFARGQHRQYLSRGKRSAIEGGSLDRSSFLAHCHCLFRFGVAEAEANFSPPLPHPNSKYQSYILSHVTHSHRDILGNQSAQISDIFGPEKNVWCIDAKGDETEGGRRAPGTQFCGIQNTVFLPCTMECSFQNYWPCLKCASLGPQDCKTDSSVPGIDGLCWEVLCKMLGRGAEVPRCPDHQQPMFKSNYW